MAILDSTPNIDSKKYDVVQNGSSHNSANLIRKMHGCKINACNVVIITMEEG